jgi:hypothetical protein
MSGSTEMTTRARSRAWISASLVMFSSCLAACVCGQDPREGRPVRRCPGGHRGERAARGGELHLAGSGEAGVLGIVHDGDTGGARRGDNHVVGGDVGPRRPAASNWHGWPARSSAPSTLPTPSRSPRSSLRPSAVVSRWASCAAARSVSVRRTRRHEHDTFWCGLLLGGCGLQLTTRLYTDRVCSLSSTAC